MVFKNKPTGHIAPDLLARFIEQFGCPTNMTADLFLRLCDSHELTQVYSGLSPFQ